MNAALILASALSVGSASPADSAWALRRHLPITEFGVSVVLTEPPSPSVQVALGDLVRIDDRTFLGGEVAVDVHGYHEKLGLLVSVRPRVRREVGNGWAVDVSAGPIIAGNELGGSLDGLGFSAAAAFEHRGSVGLSAEVMTRRLDPSGQTLTTTQVGLRLGRGSGVLAGIGCTVAYMVLAGLAGDLTR